MFYFTVNQYPIEHLPGIKLCRDRKIKKHNICFQLYRGDKTYANRYIYHIDINDRYTHAADKV